MASLKLITDVERTGGILQGRRFILVDGLSLPLIPFSPLTSDMPVECRPLTAVPKVERTVNHDMP